MVQLTAQIVQLVLFQTGVLVVLCVAREHTLQPDRRFVVTARRDRSVIQQVQRVACSVVLELIAAAGQPIVCCVHLEHLATRDRATA